MAHLTPSCEVIVTQFFPSIRALIAKELTDTLNHTQAEAARLMNITQPAICQYKKSLRGKNCKLLLENDEVMASIKEQTKELTKMPAEQRAEVLCRICEVVQRSDLMDKVSKPIAHNGRMMQYGEEKIKEEIF